MNINPKPFIYLMLPLLVCLFTTSFRHIPILECGKPYTGKIDSTGFILQNSGSIDGCYYTTIKSCVIGFCRDKDYKVNYIFTEDRSFSAEGIKIGSTYADALRAANDTKCYIEPGWGSYITLRSGWIAGFDLTYATQQPYESIADTAKITWLFKH